LFFHAGRYQAAGLGNGLHGCSVDHIQLLTLSGLPTGISEWNGGVELLGTDTLWSFFSGILDNSRSSFLWIVYTSRFGQMFLRIVLLIAHIFGTHSTLGNGGDNTSETLCPQTNLGCIEELSRMNSYVIT
jgi:hypothetical protein